MTRRSGRDRYPGDRGQGTVEFALLMPVLLVLVLAVLQVGLVVRSQVQATHAAREAARVVAVTGDADLAAAAAARAGGLDPSRLSVEVSGAVVRGGVITVSVSYLAPTDVAVVGRTIDDVNLTAEASMLVE